MAKYLSWMSFSLCTACKCYRSVSESDNDVDGGTIFKTCDNINFSNLDGYISSYDEEFMLNFKLFPGCCYITKDKQKEI